MYSTFLFKHVISEFVSSDKACHLSLSLSLLMFSLPIDISIPVMLPFLIVGFASSPALPVFSCHCWCTSFHFAGNCLHVFCQGIQALVNAIALALPPILFDCSTTYILLSLNDFGAITKLFLYTTQIVHQFLL